ncbi:Crp/Fnr family transcriptional regulator [Spirosoma lituiforme]
MERLKDYIQSQIVIDETDLDTILCQFKERKIAKGGFVLKKGQLATDYIFVSSGCLRVYFDQGDKEVTTWLALENNFFTDLSSLKYNQPSRFYIHALEETILLTIKSDKMEKLYKLFPCWQQFGRQIWETAFFKLVEGVISFQTMTAEERYLKAMQETELLKRVPLKYLASYLGVTQTSLSRLRKTIK